MRKIDFSVKGFKGGEGCKLVSIISGNTTEDMRKFICILLFQLFHGERNTDSCLAIDPNGRITPGHLLHNSEQGRVIALFSAQYGVGFPMHKAGSVGHLSLAIINGFSQRTLEKPQLSARTPA